MAEPEPRIADRIEIQDLLARYARGVDRRDWDLVRSVFHPDAHDDHGQYKGGVDGFIRWVSQRHASIPQSMHFLGNCLIEFAGPQIAVVETYYVARQRLGPDATMARTMIGEAGAGGSSTDVEILGRYLDRFERRDGAWRIARRIVAFETMRSWPAGGRAFDPAWAQSQRTTADPLVALRREAGLAGELAKPA